MKALLDKLINKQGVIGVVGLGYVGLPLLIRFAEEKIQAVGFDIDNNKVEMLNSSKSYIEHIESSSIESNKEYISATNDFSKISTVDAIILCVPTPLNKYREPDLSYVIDTTNSIIPYLRDGQIVSLESTTYPGTTEEEILPRLESTGLKVGENIYLVYSPEREDPGRKNFTTKTIPKICGGCTPACLEHGLALYNKIIDSVVPVSDTKTAEMTKLLENIHRAVNIGFVNEMKVIADKMDIDIHEVIDAAATKPFGFVPYKPGPGLGGHCIPIDPFYLTWKAREFGVHTRFIELSGEINNSMPYYVISKVSEGLNDLKKSVKDAKILILGIAYKKNVDDMRESPAVYIMDKLIDQGAQVDYSDPHVPTFPKMRNYNFDFKSVDITTEVLHQYDCVLITTDHDKFDFDLIQKNSKLIVDTRGIYNKTTTNVIKA